MGRVNISGLAGLTASDRASWDKSMAGQYSNWNMWSEDEKDALYREQQFQKYLYNPAKQREKTYQEWAKRTPKKETGRINLNNLNDKNKPHDLFSDLGLKPINKETDLKPGEIYDPIQKKAVNTKHSLPVNQISDNNPLLKAQQDRKKFLNNLKNKSSHYTGNIEIDSSVGEVYVPDPKDSNSYVDFKTLSPQEKDAVFASKMFEKEFSKDSRWGDLKNLLPEIQWKVYNNPNIFPDNKHGDLNMMNEGERTLWQGSNNWLNVVNLFSPETARSIAVGGEDNIAPGMLAGAGVSMIPVVNVTSGALLGGNVGGALGEEYYGTAGKYIGSVIGAAAGAIAMSNPITGSIVGGALAGEGTEGMLDKMLKNRSARLIDEAIAENTEKIKEMASPLTQELLKNSSFNENINPWYKEEIDKAWEEQTKGNAIWRTFKHSINLSPEQKATLMAQYSAVSTLFGEEKAYNVFNDELNNIISDEQDYDIWDAVTNGAGMKFIGSFGEALIGADNIINEAMSTMPWLDDEEKKRYKIKAANQLKGLDENGDPLPWWKNIKYWNGVDQFGTWSPNEIDNIYYDTSSDEYKEFIKNGGTKEQWIEQQENTGILKGTGISKYNKLVKTKSQHDWFSAQGGYQALAMSGYIANQWATQKLFMLGAKFAPLKAVTGRTLGSYARGVADDFLKTVGKDRMARLAVQRQMQSLANRAFGVSALAYGSIPISVGYGMSTYDEIRNQGTMKIMDQINKDIDADPQYLQDKDDIQNKYFLESLKLSQQSPEMQSDSQQQNALLDNMQQELNNLRQLYVDAYIKERQDDFDKLNEEATEGYYGDFAIELLRNMGISAAYKKWIYKDAIAAAKNTRPDKLLYKDSQGVKFGQGLQDMGESLSKLPYHTMKRLGNKVTALGKKIERNMAPVIEKENGELMRNHSFLRVGSTYAKEITKNIYGGYWSNYMDDVSSAFVSEYNLHDFNNYMARKYNPESFEEDAGFLSSVLAGVHGGVAKGMSEQAIYDGIIGAIGSGISMNPVGALRIFGGVKNFTHDSNGRKLSTVEIINQVLGNPVLGAIATVNDINRGLDTRLQKTNSDISKNQKKFKDTIAMIAWAKLAHDSRNWESKLNNENAAVGEGFSFINALYNFSNEYSKSSILNNFVEQLKTLAEGENITEEDIDNFLNNDMNKHLSEEVSMTEDGLTQRTQEDLKQYAVNAIQQNAQELLKLMNSYWKAADSIRSLYGEFDSNDDVMQQLAYTMVATDYQRDWLKHYEKRLTGSEQHSEDTNNIAFVGTLHNAQERIKDLEQQIKNTETQQKSLERGLKIAKKNSHKGRMDAETGESIDTQIKRMQIALKTQKHKKNRLKEDFKKIKEAVKEFESKSPAEHLEVLNPRVLSEEEIMDLNPDERAQLILDPEKYSYDQRKVIEALIKKKQMENTDFLEDIESASILYQRINANEELFDNLIKNKEDFGEYAVQLRLQLAFRNKINELNSPEYIRKTGLSNRRAQLLNYLTLNSNDKNIIDAVLRIIQDKYKGEQHLEMDEKGVIMKLFDDNIDEIQEALNNDDTISLSTPNETIAMRKDSADSTQKNVRDMLENAIDTYIDEKAAEEERKQDQEIIQVEEEIKQKELKEQEERKEQFKKEGKSSIGLPLNSQYTEITDDYTGEEDFMLDEIENLEVEYDIVDKHWRKQTDKKKGRDTEEEFEEDKSNRVIRICLKGSPEKGWFEIVKDNEEGVYSLHFKTFNGKHGDNQFAATTKQEREILFQAVRQLLPINALFSTWGTVTKGGVHAINKVAYADRESKKNGFTSWERLDDSYSRKLRYKGNNRSVLVPVYRKTDANDPARDAQKKVEAIDKTVEKQIEKEKEEEKEKSRDKEKEDIFSTPEQKKYSSNIALLNPLNWIATTDTARRIKELFGNLYSNLLGITNILNREKEAEPENKSDVYFYIPEEWNSDLEERFGQNYDKNNSLPIIAVIESKEGTIELPIEREDGKVENGKFIPIGLMPATNSEEATRIVEGQGRVGHIREYIQKIGYKTNQLLKQEDGKYLKSKITKVKERTSKSQPGGSLKSVVSVLRELVKMHNTQSKALDNTSEDIFEDAMIDGHINNAIDEILKNLSIKEGDGKRILVFNQPKGKAIAPTYLLQQNLQNTLVRNPNPVIFGNDTYIPILEVLKVPQQSKELLDVNNENRSRILSNFVSELEYRLQNLDINEDGEIIYKMASGTEADASEELTRVFSRVFYNSKGSSYSIKAELREINDKQYIAIDLYRHDSLGNEHQITGTDENTNTSMLIVPWGIQTLEPEVAATMLKKFLFYQKLKQEQDGSIVAEGKPIFRGDIAKSDDASIDKLQGITKLNWDFNKNDFIEEGQYLKDKEEGKEVTEHVGRRNKIKALFMDGVVTIANIGFQQSEASIAAPLNSEGQPIQVADNTNEVLTEGTKSKSKEGESADEGKTLKKMTKSQLKKSDKLIKKIRDYSKKAIDKWKQSRKSTDAEDSAKDHFSATSLAAIIYGEIFDSDSPWHLPSTTVGNNGDNFIRNYFQLPVGEDTVKGKQVFKTRKYNKEEIYKKYPIFSEEVIDRMLQALQIFETQLYLKGQTLIETSEIVVDGETRVKLESGEIVRIPNTGHLDMFTRDEQGRIHIYDFKTFRSEDNFLNTLFNKYSVQVNAYKNMMEQQYKEDGLEVASVNIIPINVDYADPNTVKYEKNADGTVTVDGDPFVLSDPNTTYIGYKISVPNLLDSLLLDDNGNIIEDNTFKLLQAIGLTATDIQKLNNNRNVSVNDPLFIKLNTRSVYSLQLEMQQAVELDYSNLTESQKNMVNKIINKSRAENGEQGTASVDTKSTSKVEAPESSNPLQLETNLEEYEGKKGDASSVKNEVNQPVIEETSEDLSKNENIEDQNSCRVGRVRGRGVHF